MSAAVHKISAVSPQGDAALGQTYLRELAISLQAGIGTGAACVRQGIDPQAIDA
jgi:hypothetical protein